MIKREKNRKLRGSVLLTVVCVMSLLIVFLFGTLALATAANNRAHVNYSTAQTGVTSRTVVDAAIKAMEADATFGNAVSAVKKDDPSSEFEVDVRLGASVPNAGRYGDISPVSIEYAGQKKFYDSDKNEWIDGDILKFTATVSMSGNDSTTSAYIVKQPPTEGDGNGGGGAGFVTTAGAALTCQTNLYGGTYINVPKLGEDNNNDGVFDAGVDKEGAIFYDYKYRTSEEYEKKWKAGTPEYDPALYRQFAPYGSSEETTFLLDKSSAIAETDLYVNNNMSVNNWSGFIFPKEGTGITVWGDLTFHDGAQSYTSNVKSSDVSETKINFNKIPYIYVDGKISQKSNIDIWLGNSSEPFPLNIFCGSIDTCEANQANNCHIAGDIYCLNPNEISRIGGNSGSKLYSWSASVINKMNSDTPEPHTTSSIYSLNKELILQNMNVDGDVRVEHDCTIRGTVTINGNLVVGGKLTIESGATLKFTGEESKLYCDETQATGLDTGIEADPKYKEVSTIEHSNPADHPYAERVENKHRYYLEYKLRPLEPGEPGYDEWNAGNKFTGLLGEIEWDGYNSTYYYKWKEDFNPDDCEGHAFVNYTDINEWNAFGIDVRNWIDAPIKNNGGNENRPTNKDGNVEYYYVETAWDDVAGKYVTKSTPTDEGEYYVNKNTHERINSYRTVPAFDGSDTGKLMSEVGKGYDEGSTSVWYEIKTETIVNKDVAAPKAFPVNALSTYPNGKIYPEYAERDVILGLKTIKDSSGNTLDKSETQIVKTMDDVLENVANPYKDGALSSELTKQHEELIAASKEEATKKHVYFENVTDILKEYNVYADDIQADGTYKEETPVLEGNVTFSSAASKKNGGVIIRNDCILNLKDTIGADMGYLVFEPGTKDMLVIVNSLNLSGAKIIVNDSQGGTVNFFIEKKDGSGGIMQLGSSTNFVAPTSYMKAFAENTSDTMSYGNVDKGGLNLNKLGKPHINIYGAPGTKLISTESGGFIANIVSSELEFIASAGSKMPSASNIEHIYYNGNEVSNSENPFIIGCINSSFATVPNGLNVLFVTDSDSEDKDLIDMGDSAFNYRVLYYDEY